MTPPDSQQDRRLIAGLEHALRNSESAREMAMEAWKDRGRQLNALYDVLAAAVPVQDPPLDNPVADLVALIAERDSTRVEVERLRERLAECEDVGIERGQENDRLRAFAEMVASFGGANSFREDAKAALQQIQQQPEESS